MKVIVESLSTISCLASDLVLEKYELKCRKSKQVTLYNMKKQTRVVILREGMIKNKKN